MYVLQLYDLMNVKNIYDLIFIRLLNLRNVLLHRTYLCAINVAFEDFRTSANSFDEIFGLNSVLLEGEGRYMRKIFIACYMYSAKIIFQHKSLLIRPPLFIIYTKVDSSAVLYLVSELNCYYV